MSYRNTNTWVTEMSSIRLRTWQTPAGESRSAYQVDYRDAAGKRQRETFATKKEAEHALAQATVGIANGTHTPANQPTTVADACTRWLADCDHRLERVSCVSYGERVRLHIVPFIGKVRLAQLSVPAVNQWQIDLRAAGRSPQAIRKARTALGAALKFAQGLGLVGQNVVANAGRPQVAKRDEAAKVEVGVDIPAISEVRAIERTVTGRFRALFLVACFGGLRFGELRGLTWANVNLDAGTVKVTQRIDRFGEVGAPKSKAGTRTIPLPPFVIQALREHKLLVRTGELGLVFTNGAGNPLHRQVAVAEYEAAQVQAGVVGADGAAKYSKLHSLRHFFASWCINRKVDGGLELPLKVVQVRIGHASVELTANTYSHLFPATDAAGEMAAAGNAFLAG